MLLPDIILGYTSNINVIILEDSFMKNDKIDKNSHAYCYFGSSKGKIVIIL